MKRAIADARERDEWLEAREGRIGASDAASFSKFESIQKYARAKMMPQWGGGAYSHWGHEREPVILETVGYEQNHKMYRSHDSEFFVATPDGIDADRLRLAQVKTTLHGFKTIPPKYQRQMWWEQFVMGPDWRVTDFIYEVNTEINGEFTPAFAPVVIPFERDDEAIEKLVVIATAVLASVNEAKSLF